jgi:uncharacterized protein YjbI with pentapeptide repeats
LLLGVAAADPAAAAVRDDAVRTGLAAAVAAGGGFALLLAFRRQRCTEVSFLHAITDAGQRQVTELYATAADQLGSEQAPVRLAGLYALERLAQDNPSQRQNIVNVICAYLQMPYLAPGPLPVDPPAADTSSTRRTRGTVGSAAPPVGDQERERYEKRELEHGRRTQEQRVRTAAQRILTRHLPQAAAEDLRWNITVDLSGAKLAWAGLSGAHLAGADLRGANLTAACLGGANLTGANLRGANLGRARLTGVKLTRANLSTADLTMASLEQADLSRAELAEADLTMAVLEGADLTQAKLVGGVILAGAYLGGANLTGADLDRADLTGAHLDRANLTEAGLTRTNLIKAVLDGVDLTRADLSNATWTDDTTWPSELRGEIRAESSRRETPQASPWRFGKTIGSGPGRRRGRRE